MASEKSVLKNECLAVWSSLVGREREKMNGIVIHSKVNEIPWNCTVTLQLANVANLGAWKRQLNSIVCFS